MLLVRIVLISLLVEFIPESFAKVWCPKNQSGFILTCAFKCCKSVDSSYEDYYCCDLDDQTLVDENTIESDGSQSSRSERFVAYTSNMPNIQIDYTLLIIGLIISIVLSVLCSLFCCLLCNGCWLHRRRNPQMYESVQETGFYPLCCGFGIPVGTVVFSTHPPQFRDENELYHGSSTSSIANRGRVRFHEDGTSKGVLKPNSLQ
ncbi:unnamed protein product [Dracunculus medinensis]|uniref:Uncharacterized protein n=1 Tax=Dracunculus medinensis TaxID=318479 RepID=A0A0N4U0P2_DRAME|nr:unnamed protein product [Dracunculus medinensis]